jgi:hypothetical protein
MPPDISEMVTVYLVPRKPLQDIRASRAEQLAAHQLASDQLQMQQAALARRAVDWQNQLYGESSVERRAEIQKQVDALWALWSEMERQALEHRQAVRALRGLDPPRVEGQQGG